MIVDMLVSEEETQIHGLKLFLDLGGVSRKLIEAWSDPTFLRNHSRILQVILIIKHGMKFQMKFLSIGLCSNAIERPNIL